MSFILDLLIFKHVLGFYRLNVPPSIDINQPLVGITLFLAALAFFYFAPTSPLLYGPKPGAKKAGEKELPAARELETKVRMKAGLDVIEDMTKLIQVYLKNQRYEDAERYCRQ